MTKVPQGFDFSFLNEEEARKILQVLERNEELRRAEKDRISKLQKTKRDIRWLQGATGEWFEEVQRKKFCNEADVNQMLKPPLTFRLQKGMAKNDPMELQTSRSKNLMNQKPSVSPRMSFRSSFASLFSFRRSGKETLKPQSQRSKGCADGAGPSLRETAAAKIYNSPVGSQPVASALVPKPAIMREESGMPPPWDASLLESEFFQVLDDLDSKLAQEQSAGLVNTRAPFSYGSRTQFKYSHPSRNRHGHVTGRHQNYRSETSNMSIYDILRPGTPREGFKTFSPRTKTIYDMYRTRDTRVLKEDFMQKNTFGSTSLCFDSRQRSASPAAGRFTARSLHFPADTQNKSSFTPLRHQQSPKRTPLSSIIWNRPDFSRHRQDLEGSPGVPSPMDIDPPDQYVSKCFQESRRYGVYHSQNTYQSYPVSTPMDNAMSPDVMEDSENVPFHQQHNPSARSFFCSSLRQSREHRFGQNSFWSQQEEHSSWSDFPHGRQPFPSSEKDFEMISIEAARAPSVCSHGVPSQHWRPRSPGYGPYVFRGQEDPHCWRSDFQTSPLESMDTSHVNENHLPPHFVTPDGFSIAGSGFHVQSCRLDSQQGHCPIEVAVDEEPCLFSKARTLVSAFRPPSPLNPDSRRESRSPSFQNSTVTLQKIISNKPDSLPIRSCTEVTVACGQSTESLSLTDTQSNIPVMEMDSEKDINESIPEDEQLNRSSQKNKPSGLPQPASQTVISNDLPDFQNTHSQESTQNDRYVFNASATESSRRSPRVFSRKGTSEIHTTQRDKGQELSKSKCFPGNRKLDSAASLPFVQESGTSPSRPNPNQGCYQTTGSHEDTSSIVKNSHWCLEPTANQKPQSPEEPALLDLERQRCPFTHSANGSKLAAGNTVSQGPSGVSSGAPQDSLPLSESFRDALLVPSTTVFSRGLSDQDPSQEQREEKNKATKNQNDQLAVNSGGSQESPDGPALTHGAVLCHPYSPFRNGRGKGRVRRRISCIEELTKTESRAAPTGKGDSLAEDQSNVRAPELSSVYCTLPRKSASFLTHSRQRESKVTAASVRNGPLPFQVKNKAEVPTGKSASDKPGSPESVSDASNSVMGTPEATKRMTDMKAIRSASLRKGPLPFLIKRATSCPSGEPCTLAGSGERETSPALDTDTSAVTPRPGGTIFNSLEGESAFGASTFSERHNQKEFAPEHPGKDGETPAPRMSSFTLSNKSPEPFGSGKERGKALHKFKTTSMFSVSGDEENVKCLEVVSIYYTLPRKPSKKFCSLLQQYTHDTDSLRDAFQGEAKAFPNALESDELSSPAQVQSRTPLLQDLKLPVDPAPCCPSHGLDSQAGSQLPNMEASKSTLEETASAKPDVSLHKGEPNTEEMFPSNLSETAADDSLSRKERGGELLKQTLQTPLLLQEKSAAEESTESHQQPFKGGNSDPSGLPSHSEDNAENSHIRRNSGTSAGGMAIMSTGNGLSPWRAHVAVAVDDSSRGSQPRETSGTAGSDCQKLTARTPSDSESQASALTPALHKLQLAAGAQTGAADPQSGPRPSGSQETNTAEMRRLGDETQKLARDQTLLPGGNNKSITNTGDLETKADRCSVKHRRASRKIPARDLSARKHVATVFSQSESKSGFPRLSLCRPEDGPLSPEPTVKSTNSADKSSLTNVNKSETFLQAAAIPNPEPPCPSCNQESNTPQPYQNESNRVSETPPKNEGSKARTSGESGAPAQPTLASPLENSSDRRQRLSPLPLEPVQKSTINFSQGQRDRSALSPEPHLYRSKSLKNFNVGGDLLCASQPPKARGRHFSENTSIDSALGQLSLEDDNSGYSRRFKSFSELPASYEGESWALHNRTRVGPKSTSSISRPIDYGIFGKEQQLAFLENVKRSLTQGRLWKPSFLKNPGFLKDEVLNASNLSQSELLNSPGGQAPEDGLFLNEPLNIYEEDPVDPMDSDWDTDTTTDDEYYLDEKDKESEL
ncbi:exophilin-5 isoform X1 [Meriones unguiculatus]|uniref:exophilin-5 isoform X1 n=3 Tax=Meriones unguiculatus TaxID=10047 RepID=UPI000B4EEA23|nr:exophilin-5 isoform X1 [Meriones unguiculatus]